MEGAARRQGIVELRRQGIVEETGNRRGDRESSRRQGIVEETGNRDGDS